MPLIIIDGHDLCGKSTILKHFRHYPIIKMPVNENNRSQIEQCSSIFNDTIRQFKQIYKTNTIFLDRGFLSSVVYGSHFNRKFDYDLIQQTYSELKSDLVYFNIYCSDNEIERRYKLRADKFYNLETIKQIKYLYLLFGESYNVINLYNETRLNLKINIERIKNCVK